MAFEELNYKAEVHDFSRIWRKDVFKHQGERECEKLMSHRVGSWTMGLSFQEQVTESEFLL